MPNDLRLQALPARNVRLCSALVDSAPVQHGWISCRRPRTRPPPAPRPQRRPWTGTISARPPVLVLAARLSALGALRASLTVEDGALRVNSCQPSAGAGTGAPTSACLCDNQPCPPNTNIRRDQQQRLLARYCRRFTAPCRHSSEQVVAGLIARRLVVPCNCPPIFRDHKLARSISMDSSVP